MFVSRDVRLWAEYLRDALRVDNGHLKISILWRMSDGSMHYVDEPIRM